MVYPQVGRGPWGPNVVIQVMVDLEDSYELRAARGTYISHEESNAIREKMTGIAWWDDLVTNGEVFKITKHNNAATMTYTYLIDFLLPEGEEVMFALRHGTVSRLRIVPTHITLQEWQGEQYRRVSTR